MTVEIVRYFVNAPLEDGSAFTLSYPTGRTKRSFAEAGHALSVRERMTIYYDATDDIYVTFSDATVNVEWRGGVTLSRGSTLVISLVLAATDDGDFVAEEDETRQFEVGFMLGAVNRLRTRGALAGHAVALAAVGEDDDIPLSYAAKGLASHFFGNGAGVLLEIADAGGDEDTAHWFKITAGEQTTFPRLSSTAAAEYAVAASQRHFFLVDDLTAFRIAGAADGDKFVEVANGTTYATFFSRTDLGTDAAPFLFDAQSSGEYLFTNDSGTIVRFNSGSSAAARPNYLQFENNSANNPPVVRARGSDTNVDIYLQTQGTGVVRFGTHSALAAETVTGYITVKDAGGTSRKIAVVS